MLDAWKAINWYATQQYGLRADIIHLVGAKIELSYFRKPPDLKIPQNSGGNRHQILMRHNFTRIPFHKITRNLHSRYHLQKCPNLFHFHSAPWQQRPQDEPPTQRVPPPQHGSSPHAVMPRVHQCWETGCPSRYQQQLRHWSPTHLFPMPQHLLPSGPMPHQCEGPSPLILVINCCKQHISVHFSVPKTWHGPVFWHHEFVDKFFIMTSDNTCDWPCSFKGAGIINAFDKFFIMASDNTYDRSCSFAGTGTKATGAAHVYWKTYDRITTNKKHIS
jgi:hypothetical protein